MQNEKILIDKNCHYLSDSICHLPSHKIINKGITGCGGTTLELNDNRNSLVLSPTKNLVVSKSSEDILGVTGDTNNSTIKNYLMTKTGYKKIIATYDALPRLMEIIPNYQEYFLLIDEYHLLFNDYSFRNDAIMNILNNFTKFNDWAFLTATPLKPECILEELKDIPQITYEWQNAVPVKLTIKDTFYVQKELIELINLYKDRNLHIFLNSIATINSVVKKLDNPDYRVVCSTNSKTKIRNYADVNSEVKPINFYTSCAFEGCDIYDENGLCIILSDTNIATTVLDIATKVRQVCGRLRDSKYKDECILILNTNKHRYAGTTKTDFNNLVSDSKRRGQRKTQLVNELGEDDYITELKLFSEETYYNLYLNKHDNKIFYDDNLRKLDLYNYDLINEIYSNSLSVLKEAQENNFSPIIDSKKAEVQGLSFIRNKLIELNKSEYTFEELKEIFIPLFKQKKLSWSSKAIILYFPKFKKVRKQVNRERITVYRFTL